jgi:hypothetical protein
VVEQSESSAALLCRGPPLRVPPVVAYVALGIAALLTLVFVVERVVYAVRRRMGPPRKKKIL